MSAYYRRRGEDRATEVLSTVLNSSPDLCTELAGLVGLPPAHSYEIRTQVRSGTVTIDLEVAGIRVGGERAWMLWSEHKVRDPLTVTQLRRERCALANRAGKTPQLLIAITLLQPSVEVRNYAEASGCPLLRWRHVVDRVMVLIAAMRANASHVSKPTTNLLAEWVDFAMHELEHHVDPLTPPLVGQLADFEKTLDTIGNLLARGFARACEDIDAGPPREVDDELQARPPDDSWLLDRGFKLYAKYVPSGGFGDVSEPCLVVGAWIEGDVAVAARRSREFQVALSHRGFSVWDEENRHGGWLEFGIPVSLVELATTDSFEEQERRFTEACLATLRSLVVPLTCS